MYDLLHFRRALYLLVMLGFIGFTLATSAPFMFVFSVGALVINGYLLRTGRFRPMPRWLANTLTLLVAIYTGLTITASQQPIFPIGNFLVILQLIKLYELRANRDYAQLLVLSLLLMVAAAISTAGLGFGLTFIAYLALSPYVCLLFHLKVEADHAKRLVGLDERQPDPITLRQDQRFLNRSMTRVTVAVAIVSTVLAILVFLFFPRVQGGNLLAFQFRPGSSGMTGMSEEMQMRSVTSVQQNTAQVAEVFVTRNDQPVTSGELYLRGTVYDIYDGDPTHRATRWSWSRISQNQPAAPPSLIPRAENEESPLDPTAADADAGDDVWTADFRPLRPLGVSFLPALPGAVRFKADRRVTVGYNPADGVLSSQEAGTRSLNYRVTSTGVQRESRITQVPAAPGRPFDISRLRQVIVGLYDPEQKPQDLVATLPPSPGNSGDAGGDADDEDEGRPPLNINEGPGGTSRSMRPRQSIIAEPIAAYARRPEVSGLDDDGRPLIEQLTRRRPDQPPPPATEHVARNIEQHLQTQFAYTLDLGDAQRSRDDPSTDEDPVVRFLYTTRKGWCEHFAYAMTLMCQSLGMQARIVSGYKVDEFNAVGGYFIVRQSHAHAWVEVLVRDGDRNVWKTFDPTGGRDGTGDRNHDSPWTRLNHVFDYLEHIWANSVVAYDSSAQSNLLGQVEGQLVTTSDKANNVLKDTSAQLNAWLDRLNVMRYDITSAIIIVLLCAMTVIALGLTGWYLVIRFRLTRRARRIGLLTLGKPEARRLARQLGFYDELVRVLERRDIARPKHLTPLEFGQSLSFLPREAYEAVVRLTRIFYRVRYGDVVLTPARQRALERVVERIRHVVNPTPTRLKPSHPSHE